MTSIYQIINLVNQKKYIGKTAHSIERRFQEHVRDSVKESEQHRPLYKAFNKYGINNFKIELLEDNLTDEEACKREQFWIANYQTYIGFDNCKGYNATLGGDSKKRYNYKEIAEKYKELLNIAATARYFNCDPETVHKACKENNVEIIFRINKRTIKCLETEKIYNSVTEAAKDIDANNVERVRKNITRALKNNGTAYHYHWIYI